MIESPGQFGKLTLFFGVVLVLFFLFTTSSLKANATSDVRFLHLAPDAGPVDTWIDGRLVGENLNFKEATDYVETSSERHRVIYKTITGQNAIILNTIFPFRDDREYTVALTGNRENDDLQLIFVSDNCPPSASLAQVKFTNAAQDSPPANLSIKYGPTLYERMAFRTAGNCQLIPPGNYLFELSETESGDLITEKEIKLKAETRYNIFATKNQENENVDLLRLTKLNAPEEVPKIFGVERSVLQLLGAGLIASLVILVLGR